MNDRKTDGGKGDRIPGANQSAYEAGYAGIQWGDGVDKNTTDGAAPRETFVITNECQAFGCHGCERCK